MKFTSFLFICGFYIALTFFGDAEWLGLNFQLLISAILILLVGIPHGAIDHIIFFEENKSVSTFQFYLFYFSLILCYTIAWVFLPLVSFIFFLLLSAFHFGQSQFSDLQQQFQNKSRWIYFSWGCSILSGLILYHISDLTQIFSQFSDLKSLDLVFNEQVFSILLPVSTFLFIILLGHSVWKKKTALSRFCIELLLLGLIHFSFFTLPILIGFTLYFCTLHSMRVLTEEFNYLKAKRKTFNVKRFIQLLFPYTILSIGGGLLLLLASYLEWVAISNILLVLILISVITLPHSFVMDGFYKNKQALK